MTQSYGAWAGGPPTPVFGFGIESTLTKTGAFSGLHVMRIWHVMATEPAAPHTLQTRQTVDLHQMEISEIAD
ncbi:hypothetical protein CQ14_18805 [Bradyrhizobium lablabi]|uniref:Uncharacterized protein n=1 Tax=Bradyrhizobium lablabi TaxID=722472 RepID=A0A0R3ML89_9BRAD|nr:hypothetical protein [Bradyrhizobium lablabi]KRR18943.1 hypothetical protein CQ14_18805 [Bradyrhizobium lablabi]